ncbi:shootin-1 [Diabrotica virgifera virgifera]|uniref:Shootin-1-like n=1 Tax=Diabrotica virgifera virgifera TaxID=50390 RepID=A0A6P7F7B8_DIAVI|nr:shootin-1 [Diabrotica virgifera virgifera]
MSVINKHPVPSKLSTNGTSNIPLRRTMQRQISSPISSKIPVTEGQAVRWKQKFEEAEEKRKALLTEKEKALRNLTDIEKKYLNLQIKHDHLETELFEKNEEFTKLSTASKNLYKEYETLKNQYETETRAMTGALKDASQWYRENKELKRKTLLLMDKDTVDEGVDAGEGESNSETDIENLNKTIKQLSTEIAELQTEVDGLKQTEFQTSEDNIRLTEDLESERQKNIKLELELFELKKEHEQTLRVMEMMKKEMKELQMLEEEHRTNLTNLKKESDAHKREKNVLKHQSTLILQGLNESEGSDNYLLLLQEIEDLKRTLEDERNKHDEEVTILQERLEDQDNNAQIEVLEERLKLVESELQTATERAERAEEKLKAPPAPPPPPPPPLPPMLPPLSLPASDPPAVPLRRRRSKVALSDLAESIGVQENTQSDKKPAAAPGVNEDIINAIKAGQFTLRKAKKEKEKQEQKEQPKAVSELLNILGSLRRAPKKRQSQFYGDLTVNA